MANPENKQIPYESTQKDIRDAIESVATAIGGIAIPSADHVSYDNSGSGLSATDVQNALDEIVSDIPTVNDGTLTIQQNGEAKGTFTANQSGNSTVNIETPTTDIQTAVDEFSTYNGGILDSLKVALSPNQDLHGYSEPWVGGAGKNKLPLVLADIKSANTSGTWSGNVYTISGGTFEVLVDDADNVLGIKVNGTFNATTYFDLVGTFDSTYFAGMTFNGIPSTTSATVRISGANRVGLQNIYSGDTTIVDNGSNLKIAIRVATDVTTINELFKPMIRLSTESDPTFAPYSNICPISGHTQVEVDVSDGETTQEQITVNLGGTYYSGVLDIVSGVLTVDSAFIASYNGESLPSTWISDRDVYAVGTTPTTGAEVCYKLATPTPIQLSPTMVKALVGENHLSAPLDGQEITESKYRELFTWDEVESYVNAHSGGGGGVDYSTTEVDTGIKWIDGKPIYMRTFTNVGLPQNSYSATLDLGVEADTIVKIEANDSANAGNATIIFEGIYAKINKTAGNNTILNPTNQLAHLSGATLTVYYTKATD